MRPCIVIKGQLRKHTKLEQMLRKTHLVTQGTQIPQNYFLLVKARLIRLCNYFKNLYIQRSCLKFYRFSPYVIILGLFTESLLYHQQGIVVGIS